MLNLWWSAADQFRLSGKRQDLLLYWCSTEKPAEWSVTGSNLWESSIALLNPPSLQAQLNTLHPMCLSDL